MPSFAPAFLIAALPILPVLPKSEGRTSQSGFPYVDFLLITRLLRCIIYYTSL
jgi:hypothetical protein